MGKRLIPTLEASVQYIQNYESTFIIRLMNWRTFASAHSSSTNNLGVGGSAWMVLLSPYNYQHSSVSYPHCCLISAKRVQPSSACLKTDWPVASLPSFNSACSSFAVHKICAVSKSTVDDTTDRCVWIFDTGCCGTWSTSEWLQLCMLAQRQYVNTVKRSTVTVGEFWVVGSYTRTSQSHRAVKLGGWHLLRNTSSLHM